MPGNGSDLNQSLELAGRVPIEGEAFALDDLEFTATSVQGRPPSRPGKAGRSMTSEVEMPIPVPDFVEYLETWQPGFQHSNWLITGSGWQHGLIKVAELLGEDAEFGLLVPSEGSRDLTIDDFFPHKKWRVLAIAGSMLTDPYTDCEGVEQLERGVYRVTVRASTRSSRLKLRGVALGRSRSPAML